MGEIGIHVPDGAAGVPRMAIRDFRQSGLLQELNRQFLAPLGLAIETVTLPDGQEVLGGVWDFRTAPGGLVFARGSLEPAGERYVDDLRRRNALLRRQAFGSLIQPIEGS